MAGIRTRSPYFVAPIIGGLERVVLELHIYKGTKDTSKGSPIYILDADAIGTRVNIDISSLVGDYASTLYPENYTAQHYWVSYRYTSYVGGTPTVSGYTHLSANQGWTWFEEGINKLWTDRGRASNQLTHYASEELYESITIPVNTEFASTVSFYSNGALVSSQSYADATNETELVTYLEIARTGGFNNTTNDRMQLGNRKYWIANSDIDEVRISYTGFNTVIHKIEYVQCSKYKPHRMYYLNKNGVIDQFNFFGANSISLESSSDTYKRHETITVAYPTDQHSYRQLNKNGRVSMVLNTGWINESQNKTIEEILFSERVWVFNDATEVSSVLGNLPCNIKTSSFRMKTGLNEKLINYTIEVEFAYDKVNNVR